MFLMFAGRFSYSIFTSYRSHTIHRMMECSSIEKNADDEKKCMKFSGIVCDFILEVGKFAIL